MQNTRSSKYNFVFLQFLLYISPALCGGIDLIISVNSDFAHPTPRLRMNSWVLGIVTMVLVMGGSAGNGNQVLGRHLPTSAPAEAPLLLGGPQSLSQGGGSCVWPSSSSSKWPSSIGPKEIQPFSTPSTPLPTPRMGNIYHSVSRNFL